MSKARQSIENKVKSRIYGKGRGWVFTQKDFGDLGSYFAIRKALLTLEEKGFITRISHGIYEYPRTHKTLGKLPPSLPKVAEAIARRDNIRIQPSGALAANMLGISEQVPAKVVYLTDTNSKKIKINRQELIFKKTTPKRMSLAGKMSGLVIEAVRYLGEEGVEGKAIKTLQARLQKADLKILKKDSLSAPAWVQKIIKEICYESS